MNIADSQPKNILKDAASSEPISSILRKAEAALKTSHPQESTDMIQMVLRQDPTHVGALELLAKAQWQLNRYSTLLETLPVLIRINPYEPGYYMLQANALRNLGRYGESLRSFVRAGETEGAMEAVAELSALQSDLVIHLLSHDPIFKAQYAQDPERACAGRGFEFGSETKIRHQVLANEYSTAKLLQRPS
jgi:tetratricopeptide (TPR) repeat protein